MAKKKALPSNKIIGLILIVVGIGLGYWGYEMSNSLGSQLSSTFAGSPPNEVMYRYIAGAACFVVGIFLVRKK